MAENDASTALGGALVFALTGAKRGEPRPAPPALTPLDAGPGRASLGPLALMLATPALAVLLWMANVHHGGSLWAMATSFEPAAFLAQVPRPSWSAAGLVLAWVALQFALLALLPGKELLGPVTPAGVQPVYKLNGVAAWVVTHGGLALAWGGGWLSPTLVWDQLGSMLVTLCLGAFVFCVFLYWKGRFYPNTPDTVYTGNLLFDFFQGVELHPRVAGVNLKQLINCRVSMMGWSAMVLSFAVAEHALRGQVSVAMLTSAAVLVVYLFKFFWWEGGYFHSLDIMHDRFGYYICWGVLVWVPAVYTITAQYLVAHDPWPGGDLSPAAGAAIFLLGVASIWANYDADAQRQRVRATGGQTTVWGRPPVLIEASYTPADGVRRTNLLLASGWWGLARHFHYIPELLLALAWTLPGGLTHFLPWFYLFFLSILLTDRAMRDDKRCAAKYGPDWDTYRQRVRWKMVPGIW